MNDNATLKERWVAALRSGEYLQGHGALAVNYGSAERNCCLGVLCRVAGGEATREYQQYPLLRTFSAGHQLMKKLGFSTETERQLAVLNDDEMYSFDEIADWIEENL